MKTRALCLSPGRIAPGMTLARAVTDREGNKVEKTTWFKIEAWGKLGEIINQYTHKGDLVMIVGEVKEPRPYENKEGKPACQLEVIASQVRFLSSKNGASTEAAAEEPQVAEGEEIPF